MLRVCMSSVLATTRIVRNAKLIAAEIDGDLVMMSVDHGEYFGITGVGSRVWELLATPTTLPDIVRVICAEHAVEEASCRDDMQRFVDELVQLDLVSAV